MGEVDLTRDGAVLETRSSVPDPACRGARPSARDPRQGEPEELDRPYRRVHPPVDRREPSLRPDRGGLPRAAVPRGDLEHVHDQGASRARAQPAAADARPGEGRRRRIARARTRRHPILFRHGLGCPNRSCTSTTACSSASTSPTAPTATRRRLPREAQQPAARSLAHRRARSHRLLGAGRVRARRPGRARARGVLSVAVDRGVSIPPEYAAEMAAYDPTSGELRTHYAGFFDPGFGYDEFGLAGSQAALEVRAHDVPFMVQNGQRVCRITFEHLVEPAEMLYGESHPVELPGPADHVEQVLPPSSARVTAAATDPLTDPVDAAATSRRRKRARSLSGRASTSATARVNSSAWNGRTRNASVPACHENIRLLVWCAISTTRADAIVRVELRADRVEQLQVPADAAGGQVEHHARRSEDARGSTAPVRVSRALHGVPGAHQEAAQQLARAVVVVDDQHLAWSAVAVRRPRGPACHEPSLWPCPAAPSVLRGRRHELGRCAFVASFDRLEHVHRDVGDLHAVLFDAHPRTTPFTPSSIMM